MTREYANSRARLLRRTGNHIRIDLGDHDALSQLGYAYIARPIYPIIVTPDLEILDGNRRHAGVMLVNPDAEVPICKTDERWSDAAKLEIQLESAAHTKGLTDYEQYLGCAEWLELHPDATAKDLAARIHQ